MHRPDMLAGAQLPSRPVGHAPSIADPGPSRTAARSETVPTPAKSGQHKFLLLLPHAACLVQARIRMAGRTTAVGGAVDRLPEQQFPPLHRRCDLGKA